MKKCILLLVTLFVFTMGIYTTEAQIKTDPLMFGAIGQIGISNIVREEEGASGIIAYAVGGFMKYSFSEEFLLNVELKYATKGAEDDIIELDYGYIDIPILANLKLDNLGLLAGPSFNFNISNDYTFANGYSGIVTEPESFELSLILGAEFWFTDKIIGDFRVNYGLTDVIADTKAKNIQILIGLKYIF